MGSDIGDHPGQVETFGEELVPTPQPQPAGGGSTTSQLVFPGGNGPCSNCQEADHPDKKWYSSQSDLAGVPTALIGRLDPRARHYPVCKTITAALGWGVLVESALLNRQLNEDYDRTMAAAGRGSGVESHIEFYGPKPTLDARQAFVDYVNLRWPIRIFSLDPVVDSRTSKTPTRGGARLQIALAMGFVSGTINAQGLLQSSRQLEWDMATVALNQTAIGFSHGDDTFGWRFYPRFQTPPNQGQCVGVLGIVAGGPTTDQDMRERQLEPMQRECVAIVVMPSFVPYVTFESRSRFFRLTDPKCTEISMRQTMLLSRSIKAMQQMRRPVLGLRRRLIATATSNCCSTACTNSTETLPMQSMRVPVAVREHRRRVRAVQQRRDRPGPRAGRLVRRPGHRRRTAPPRCSWWARASASTACS